MFSVLVISMMLTQWAAKVDASAPLQEYPRPQMVRSEWINLNGRWDYAITPGESHGFKSQGKITVPFAVESALSSVQRRLEPSEALWYERTFTVPSKWKGKRILLNFGAVDWSAQVWVNGKDLGTHTGGFTPFTIDITSALKARGRQVLRVKVLDATDHSWQPRGKQWLKPAGIWYTPVSGIWQTVWLEPVADSHIVSYYAESSINKGELHVKSKVSGEFDRLLVELFDGNTKLSEASGENAVLKIQSPKLWSPDSPFLYGLKITVFKGGKAVDAVSAYAAFREISIIRDSSPWRYRRFALNGEMLFQFGPLDQGWWPDGLYTAPTDEALRYDIERTKAWGFNMIRKHIKVEPARWYYWCDVLGIMVWQDMPCIGDFYAPRKDAKYPGDLGRGEEISSAQTNTWSRDSFVGGSLCDVPPEWKQNYYKEWGEIIDALKGFPSIVVWVPFNEAWGQFDTGDVVRFTREKDPTRLVNPSSGGNFDLKDWGDIIDTHHYPFPAMNAFDAAFVNVLGEYGGIGYPVPGHIWNAQGRNWGYGDVKTSGDGVLEEYAIYAEMLKEFKKRGLSAAVYTQTTDVELEVNGLMTYDRDLVKVDEAALRSVNVSVIDSSL